MLTFHPKSEPGDATCRKAMAWHAQMIRSTVLGITLSLSYAPSLCLGSWSGSQAQVHSHLLLPQHTYSLHTHPPPHTRVMMLAPDALMQNPVTVPTLANLCPMYIRTPPSWRLSSSSPVSFSFFDRPGSQIAQRNLRTVHKQLRTQIAPYNTSGSNLSSHHQQHASLPRQPSSAGQLPPYHGLSARPGCHANCRTHSRLV